MPNRPEQNQRGDQQEWEPSGAGEHEAHTLVFRPLNPTPLRRMIVRAIAGPLVWLIALIITGITLRRTQAIEVGVLIAAGAALRSETIGLIRGPRSSRVVWDIPREDMKEGR